MEAFVAHTGRGAPLRRSAAVPDLLAGWLADPGLVLSRPEYEGATILISSPDFGACLAGEHPASERAASALAGHGFLVVISARFDEVFRNNITKSGVFPLCLPIRKVSELQDIVENDPVTLLTVHLGNREVTMGDRFSAVFDIASWPLPSGLASISPAARRRSGSAQPDGQRVAWLPADGLADLAGWIRTAQHRISCLDVPADVRIRLQRRLVAVCDAMKATAADPARCERRLASLTAELDRLGCGPQARGCTGHSWQSSPW